MNVPSGLAFLYSKNNPKIRCRFEDCVACLLLSPSRISFRVEFVVPRQ